MYMCTKYFMIDNLLEVFHLTVDLCCHGVEWSSIILPSLLLKFVFIAIHHKYLQGMTF